jgi:hypothetical protein
MNRPCCLATVVLMVVSMASAAEIVVAPDGKAGAAGTADAPLASLVEAIERAGPGDVIRLRGGTYRHAQTIAIKKSGTPGQPIRIEPADGTRPVFDFSAMTFDSKNRGFSLSGDHWHISGIEIAGAGDNGLNISGHHNVVERCVFRENRDSGLQISSTGSHNLVSDCDSYRNFDDQTAGENADGFAAKGKQIGEGNVFRRCRAWENSDDGWDLWEAPAAVLIEDCVAFRNGYNLWNAERFTGNGNGFKLGGNHVAANHVVRRCVTMEQPLRGFNLNNNTGVITIEDCVAVRCTVGFWFPAAPADGSRHVLKNNVSLDSPVRIADGSVEQNNLWTSRSPAPTSRRELD